MSALAKKVAELFGEPQKAEERVQKQPPWPCPWCSQPAIIEDVCPSLDGERTLVIWRCQPCETVGCTPDSLWPPAWVPAREQ